MSAKANLKISPHEISVVVQGPIYGKSGEAPNLRYTKAGLESVRKYLPGSEIILSTWQGSDLAGLDFDVLVTSEDPGPLLMLGETGRPFTNNVNRLIVSTKEGIKRATRKYLLKLRSDLVLTGNDFLKYYGIFERRAAEYQILKNRVLAMYGCNPHRCSKASFHPSDWYSFGLKEDVFNIWDVPLLKGANLRGAAVDGYYDQMVNLAAEQYVWVSFLRKYGPVKFEYFQDTQDDARRKSDLSQVNNLVFLTAAQLNIKSLKHCNRGHATTGFRRMIFYTHNEWRRLYNQYCHGDLKIVPHPQDGIDLLLVTLFFKMLPLNRWFKANHPKLHEKFRGLYYRARCQH
jgi:hypothetical protein